MDYIVKIRYEGRDRQIGIVVNDSLVCVRNVEKHLFRHGRDTVKQAREDGVSAWGLDCKVCDGLIARGVIWLEITSESHTQRCKLIDMKERGHVLNIKPHRAQYFLNEKYFEVYRR